MRVVLDTNVLVAGLASAAGPPGWVVEAAIAGNLEPVFDMAVRQEYEEGLRRAEFRVSSAHVEDLLPAVDRFGLPVPAASPWPVPLPDPDDEPFLAVAATTGSILVTGNLRHFQARCRRGVSVLTPRELVDHLRPRKP